MPEVWFYQFDGIAFEAALPGLIEKSLERGWRVLLRCGSEAGLAAIDAMLWSYRDDSFLAHGTMATGHAARQPVYLTLGDENPAGAEVLMLVDGARAAPGEMGAFERCCLMFDGGDAQALEAARDDWRRVTAAGLAARYWAQERGRWVQRAGG